MGNCLTVYKQTTNQKKGHKLVLQWKNSRWENTKILKFSYLSYLYMNYPLPFCFLFLCGFRGYTSL